MSLNGLEAPEINEAYQTALNEGGRWFFLKYSSRDEVQLHEKGHGGALEAQEAVKRYPEDSPLYGFILYRRRKVLLKYVPEGTSRLLKARVTVHFQAVEDKFTPHDAVHAFASAEELEDSALSSELALHTAASIKSTAESHLSGITEDDGDARSEATQKPKSVVEKNVKEVPSPSVDDDARTRHEKATEIINAMRKRDPSPPQTQRVRGPSEANKGLPSTPSHFVRDHTKPQSVFNYDPRPSISSVDGRMSSQSARPSTRDLASAYEYKGKIRFGPRPSVESVSRPSTAGAHGSFRPVAALPAGLRMPVRKAAPSRPSSEQRNTPFAGGPPPRIPLPTPPSNVHKNPTSLAVNGSSSQTKSIEDKATTMTPEKKRLMKALELRNRQIAARKDAGSSQGPENLAPAETKRLQVDSSSPSNGVGSRDVVAPSSETHKQGNSVDKAYAVNGLDEIITQPPEDSPRDTQDSPISGPEPSEGHSTKASSILDEETPSLKQSHTSEETIKDEEEKVQAPVPVQPINDAQETSDDSHNLAAHSTVSESGDLAQSFTPSRAQIDIRQHASPDAQIAENTSYTVEDPSRNLSGMELSSDDNLQAEQEIRQDRLEPSTDSSKVSIVSSTPLTEDFLYVAPNTSSNESAGKVSSDSEAIEANISEDLPSLNPFSWKSEDTLDKNGALPFPSEGHYPALSINNDRHTSENTSKNHDDDLPKNVRQVKKPVIGEPANAEAPKSALPFGQILLNETDTCPPDAATGTAEQGSGSPALILTPGHTSGEGSHPGAEALDLRRLSQESNASTTRPEKNGRVEEPEKLSALNDRLGGTRSRKRGFSPLKRTSSPDQSDEQFLSDDSFMEELKTASVQEAKPISVSKSPIKPVFSRHSSDHRSLEKPKTSRSASSPMRVHTEHARNPSPPPLPTPSSIRSFSASNNPFLSPQVAGAAPTKKFGVSSSISARIKALEQLSSRPTSPVLQTTPQATFISLSDRKSSLQNSPQTPDIPAFSATSSRPGTTPHSPSTSPQLPSFSTMNAPVKGRPESISVTATIVRDADDRSPGASSVSSEQRKSELHRSPLLVEHQPMSAPPFEPLQPPRPQYARQASARSESSSNSGYRKDLSPKMSRRESFASWRSGSSRNGSDLDLPRSASDKSLGTTHEGSREDKKESKGKRLLKRMSNISVSKRSLGSALGSSPKEAAIMEHQESIEQHPSSTVDLGDLNVQFPDTLLWKRRHMIIDEKGVLSLLPSSSERNPKIITKSFALAEFRTPYIPDQDRQELPNSIIFDFKNGSTLQCACDTPKWQTEVFNSLRQAHSTHVS